MSDQDKLDDAKKRYLTAKQDIGNLRLKIAHATCPFTMGDIVSAMSGDRLVKFVVEHIWYATNSSIDGELLSPVVGAPTGWTVSGPRIRKSDGEPGKHRFAVNSLDFHLDGDVWVQHKQTLSEILGIP